MCVRAFVRACVRALVWEVVSQYSIRCSLMYD